jgi:HPt (histidine-containing phosphotransfer) domain-containing protein
MIDILRWPQFALCIVAETGIGVAPSGTIDRDELMAGLSLGSGAEPALVIDVIDVLLHDGTAAANSLRDAITSNDAKGMLRAIHTLKSSAVMVAASALSRAAATAEAHARQDHIQEIQYRIHELAAMVDVAARKLANIQADLRRSQRLV